ncbi:AcrR family transcriptional regulator [Nocardia sp. GAS34]
MVVDVRKYGSTSPELLTDAVFDIAGSRGLEAASIREVAQAAGVSIGAVQHHFTTKDELYTFAFAQLVDRVRGRLAGVDPNAPLEDRLSCALRQLLPLDDEREREARVMLAFAARAATNDSLAEIQRRTLAEIRAELGAQLAAGGIDFPEVHATILLALVDGLTLDALSARGQYSRADLVRALTTQVRMVLAEQRGE